MFSLNIQQSFRHHQWSPQNMTCINHICFAVLRNLILFNKYRNLSFCICSCPFYWSVIRTPVISPFEWKPVLAPKLFFLYPLPSGLHPTHSPRTIFISPPPTERTLKTAQIRRRQMASDPRLGEYVREWEKEGVDKSQKEDSAWVI